MYFSEKWLDLDQRVILQWMTWERTWERFLRENQGMRSNKEDRKAGVRGLAQTSLSRSTAFYIQLARSGGQSHHTMGWSQQEADHTMLHKGNTGHVKCIPDRVLRDLGLIILVSSWGKVMLLGTETVTPWRPRPESQPRPCQVYPWTRTQSTWSLCSFIWISEKALGWPGSQQWIVLEILWREIRQTQKDK